MGKGVVVPTKILSQGEIADRPTKTTPKPPLSSSFILLPSRSAEFSRYIPSLLTAERARANRFHVVPWTTRTHALSLQ